MELSREELETMFKQALLRTIQSWTPFTPDFWYFLDFGKANRN